MQSIRAARALTFRSYVAGPFSRRLAELTFNF